MATRNRVPAVDGWFTDDGPALLGGRCTLCGTYVFPNRTPFCPNPVCAGSEFDEVRLSRRGRIWSYTDARYQPPPPYIAPADPFAPFAIAAVELADERIVVMGQVVAGVDVGDLRIGTEVELVVETLYSDDETDYTVWKWRPVEASVASEPR